MKLISDKIVNKFIGQLKILWRFFYRFFPIILSVLFFLIIGLSLYCELQQKSELKEILNDFRDKTLTVSGILSAILITFLTSKVLQIRQEKLQRVPDFKDLTQKLHKFRNIINRLIHSNLWVDGLWIFIDTNYQKLSHFDVREMAFVGSKPTELATKYIRDHKFGDLGDLYLELKSFLFDPYFDQTLYSEFEVPVYYSKEIVEKWIKYECGGGFWYYFEYKYAAYKPSLRVDQIYIGDQTAIKEICLKIDYERYKNIEFGPELLAKLGTQFHSEIIPKLSRLQTYAERGLPSIVNFLFIVLGLLIFFGIAVPLLIKLFFLNPLFDIISISVVLTICFYLITSFYQAMKKENKIY